MDMRTYSVLAMMQVLLTAADDPTPEDARGCMAPQEVYLALAEVVPPAGHGVGVKQKYPVGTVLCYSCEFGYGFPDWTTHKNVTCAKTTYGVIWRPRLPDCVEMRCTAVPSWEGIIPGNKNRRVGSEINYTCAEGLYFSDGDEVKFSFCDDTREWTPPLEPCIGTLLAEALDEPTEGEHSSTIGMTVVWTSVVLLVVFAVLDLLTIGRSCSVLTRNLSGVGESCRKRQYETVALSNLESTDVDQD